MLISIVYTLRSEDDATLPRTLGRANYAQVLAQLNRVESGLGGQVHEGEGPKPITCSDVLNARVNRAGMQVAAGTDYYLRVTGLTAAASQGLQAALLADPPEQWELDGYPFRFVAATADPDEHGWAGQNSYESLAAAQMLQGGSPRRKVTLQFGSATAFKSGGMQVPLPTPDLVFGSLVDRWNAFSPVTLSPEVRRFGEERVAISRYRLESRPVVQKNGALRIGGVGKVTYTALGHPDRYWLNTLQMLADFARFSGVGVQTASGMGQVRRVGG